MDRSWLVSLVFRISNSNAIEQSSGKFETYFFEFLYRVAYLAGLSFADFDLLYLLYSWTVKSLSILLVCSEFWCFFSAAWTMDTLIDSVNTIIIQLSAAYKYKTRLRNEAIFKKLASSMESSNFDLSTDERKKLLELWQKRNEACLKLLLALGTCTIIAWFIYPLLDELEYNLMVPIRMPYEYKTETLYPATYIGVIITFSYVSYFVMVNDLIIQAHIMHLLCQFAVLNDCCINILRDCSAKFKHVNEDKLYTNKQFQEVYIKRLGDLVNQHRFILKNTAQLRDILSMPMLVQMAVSTTLICSIGYQVAMLVCIDITKWLMSFLFLGYNMFGLYIMCRWCEEIKIQSEKIGEAIYFSGWERGPMTIPGVRIRILLIIARANKPLILSAGGMYDLSLDAYAKIVKTSYSALTMLLRLRQD